MAAPTFSNASAGSVVTTGSGSESLGVGSIGQVSIFQVFQDGTGANPGFTTNSTLSDLAGSGANTFTTIGTFDVGNPVAAKQHLIIARSIATATATFSVTGVGDDCYIRAYRFNDVNAGSTLADVIENSSAGATANGTGTSTTVSDTGVTTLGADRLALNFVGINDDATGIAVFAGASGGTWTNFLSFESATGTDGTVAYQECTLASAGTINGGSDTITSDAWGVVGFALIPAATAAFLARPLNTELQAVNRGSVW